MRWNWHFGLGPELGYAFWALTFFEAVLGSYAPIWPLWIEHLGAPIAVVGVVLASQGIVRPFVLGPGAAIVDRLSTRHVLIVCRSMSVVGLIVAATAQRWEILFVTVLFNALGELVFPTIHSYVAHYAGDDPVHAFNMTITIGPAGGLIITPLISGLVIAWGGMRAAFVLSALLTVAALWFVSKMDFSVSHADTTIENRATYRSILQHTEMRNMVVLHALTIAALGIGVALISNFLEEVRGIDPSLIAILSAGAAVGTVSFGFASARIRWLRPYPVLAAAIATGIVGVGLLLFATQSAVPIIAVAYLFRGGVFSAWALFLAAMGKVAPANLRSRGFSVMEILGGSMMSFGPLAASQLWDIDPRTPLFVAACLAFAMVVAMLWYHLRDTKSAAVARPDIA
jgi:predicted MFS family arabinose efflux permease